MTWEVTQVDDDPMNISSVQPVIALVAFDSQKQQFDPTSFQTTAGRGWERGEPRLVLSIKERFLLTLLRSLSRAMQAVHPRNEPRP